MTVSLLSGNQKTLFVTTRSENEFQFFFVRCSKVLRGIGAFSDCCSNTKATSLDVRIRSHWDTRVAANSLFSSFIPRWLPPINSRPNEYSASLTQNLTLNRASVVIGWLWRAKLRVEGSNPGGLFANAFLGSKVVACGSVLHSWRFKS